MSAKRPSLRGTTLIELIVFIVIVSVALAGVLSALNVNIRGSADPLQSKQALAIAEALMEEVTLKNYSNPAVGGYVANCPTTCDRTQFDDVGDFNNFSATLVPNYPAAITVSGESSADLGVAAKKIVVTVTQPDTRTITLAGYRANY